MRLIVTTNIDGRSLVLSDAPVPDQFWTKLWSVSPSAPLGLENESDPVAELKPLGVGEANWSVVSVPPAAEMREAFARGVPGFDENGFHLTGTVDFVVVLDGSVTLALDNENVEIHAGDLVVQRDTNHAWWNHNEHPIRLLALMMGTSK